MYANGAPWIFCFCPSGTVCRLNLRLIDSYPLFRRRLKAHLFQLAFNWSNWQFNAPLFYLANCIMVHYKYSLLRPPKKEVMFSLWSVCLSVGLDNWKSCERILTKFLGGVGTNEFNFGDDPDHHPDPGVRSGSRSGSGKNCHIVNRHRTDAMQKSFSNYIMLAFGRGLCFLSTSSCDCNVLWFCDRTTRCNTAYLTAWAPMWQAFSSI